jgi:hypothetical protein
MEDYTLGLALFDYLPVIAAGFGLYLICKYCASLANYDGYWIVVIPAIALTGGTLKASWKLVYVLTEVNHRWMSEQLFFLLAASYVFMAVLVISSIRASGKGRGLAPVWWYSPAVVAIILLVTAQVIKLKTDSAIWSVMLLATLSLANLALLATLIIHSVKKRNWIAGSAFAINLVLGYVLVNLARIPEQTAELQWIEEFINLANNSLLAVGAWALIRARKTQAT